MFGLEILDVVIGLMFVYLLLALLATALNEYISAVLNLRGRELARGLGRLLEDLDEKEAARTALRGLRKEGAAAADALTQRFYEHPLIRPLATRRLFSNRLRLPSYIPARTFAMALLDVLGYDKQGADDPVPPAGPRAEALVRVMNLLKRESPVDVAELRGMLEKASLPENVVTGILTATTGAQTRLQHLHDSVEVWFNNAMDRVSGTYKRSVQAMLLALGVAIAAALNADTIQMWRQLAEDDALRTAMVQRATTTLPTLDSLVNRPAQDSVTLEDARRRYQAARKLVSETDLQLGWARTGPRSWPSGFEASLLKILGLLLTGIAISMGAPFWFDLLNRVIAIRASGRAPDEKPKSPQGAPKRAAEDTPK